MEQLAQPTSNPRLVNRNQETDLESNKRPLSSDSEEETYKQRKVE
jgi:hypothetical protein